MQKLIQAIAADCGLDVLQYEQVHGGDTSECYCIHSQFSRYFLKVNDANRFPGMFEMETDGLKAFASNGSILVPEVINHGIINNKQWLLLQWLDGKLPAKNSMQKFGAALANVHQQPQLYVGWHRNNYIGSLKQLNTQHNSWAAFYTQCRIMPLVKLLFDNGVFSKSDIAFAESFCKRAADLFPPEPPALLHGDLWNGNYMITTDGKAAIFDPAVYYGHREMEIAMTKLFGGFSEAFYDAYHEVYPLEKGWQQRLPLTQLYPLLVHAVLFGGHYIESARQIIKTVY